MTCDREFSDPTITHHGKFTQHAAVVGMPDLHPGRGYPIGAAFFLLVVFTRQDVAVTVLETEAGVILTRCVRRGRAVNMSIKPLGGTRHASGIRY